jgi:hypothetical protein
MGRIGHSNRPSVICERSKSGMVDTGREPGREFATELEAEKPGVIGVVGTESSAMKRTRWRCN